MQRLCRLGLPHMPLGSPIVIGRFSVGQHIARADRVCLHCGGDEQASVKLVNRLGWQKRVIHPLPPPRCSWQISPCLSLSVKKRVQSYNVRASYHASLTLCPWAESCRSMHHPA
ncbi:hypothetical protein ABBQ38_013804 [Trebouxia sp. C0009 RCD-2024]